MFRIPDKGVDVALATNMISVGLDIGRLGLMVVQGQPKTAAEYIQATSRVGRRADKPGLVLALLNVHKPRDRLHYEGFRHFHECFYRAVEATSVTPWAARALDRALAAVVVAAARHLIPALTPGRRGRRNRWIQVGPRDDREDDPRPRAPLPTSSAVTQPSAPRSTELLDAWEALANDKRANAETLYYGYPREKALLHDPLDPLLATLNPDYRRFTAGRSMRDVEHAAVLKITDPYGQPLT